MSEFDAAVIAARDAARAHGAETERAGQLPDTLVDLFRRAGFFRLCVPRRLGGAEAPPRTLLETIEQLATGDASAGWCVMIGATTGILSGWLPADGADEVFGDAGSIAVGVVAPRGHAERVGEGPDTELLISGQWPFVSGCRGASWITVAVPVDGVPMNVFVPAADLEILDTWTVAGLQGTGSHDVRVAGAQVPIRRAACIWAGSPIEDGPLYAFPVIGLLALAVAAVGLGTGRAALDEIRAVAEGKTPTGAANVLAERPGFHQDLARAEAGVRSARSWFYETVDEVWEAVTAGDEVAVEQRALLRLAATRATWAGVEAVDMAYTSGGGTALYARSPLQRQFRDVHAITQHITVAPPTWELAGRILAGRELGNRVL